VVLAAGAGTRLRPLTLLRPKALCPVNTVPLVELAMRNLTGLVSGIAVNVHHLRAPLEQHLRGRAYVSVEEPEALGSAGAIGALRGWIDGRDVLVHNADAYLPDGVGRLLAGWDRARPRLLVREEPEEADFGRWRYLGVSLLPWRQARECLPVVSGLYQSVWRGAEASGDIEFVPYPGLAVDCGRPRDYLLANMAASDGASVIGAGAVVEGEVIRSVLWPGATVHRGERLVEVIRAPVPGGPDLSVAAGPASVSQPAH
jgi:MurNAc alpha-1-phosphate uridylyltransferase